MARVSWAKKLTPTFVRVGRGAGRVAKRFAPAGSVRGMHLGARFGAKVRGLRGHRKARTVKWAAALAGFGAYRGARYKKNKRLSSTQMS